MAKVYCPNCIRNVTPRKELTNRAQIENIPIDELTNESVKTIWTGNWLCPVCKTPLCPQEEVERYKNSKSENPTKEEK